MILKKEDNMYIITKLILDSDSCTKLYDYNSQYTYNSNNVNIRDKVQIAG